MKQFDVIAVGGGTAGITAALAARSVGVRVALIEREPRLGGECTFHGCVPSKALLEIARVVHDARRAASEGIFVDAPSIDFGKIVARRRRIVEEIAADDRDERFERAGIERIRGEARFVSGHELDVGDERVWGKSFVVATGSVILTVSPPPGVSAATMAPPMASVKPLATARPSPTPTLRSSNR